MAKRIIKTVDGKTHCGNYADFSEYDDYVEYESFFSKKRLYKRMIIEDSTDTSFANILVTLIIVLGIAVGIGLTIIEDNVQVKTFVNTHKVVDR